MRFILTNHVQERMSLRNITVEEIKMVFENHYEKEKTEFDRINIYGKIKNKIIRVTYREEGKSIIIITVVRK